MKFIAHRGYSRRFPENSIQAFQAVIDHPQNGRSLIGIELDIHLTADGRIPVMHDVEVKDEGGVSVPVSSISFSSLQNLFMAGGADRDHSVPDIDEVLKLVSHRTELCFEVKRGEYDLKRFTALFTESLKRYGPKDDIVISSFSSDILSFIIPKTSHLGVRYGFIFNEWREMENLPQELSDRLDFLHPDHKLVLDNPDRLLERGLPVQCWTVDDVSTVRSLIDLPGSENIRAIMTNDIELSEKFGEPL